MQFPLIACCYNQSPCIFAPDFSLLNSLSLTIPCPHPPAKLSPILRIQYKCPLSSWKSYVCPCVDAVTPACSSFNTLNLSLFAPMLLCTMVTDAVIGTRAECALEIKQLDYFTYVGSCRELSAMPGMWWIFNAFHPWMHLLTTFSLHETKVSWDSLGHGLAAKTWMCAPKSLCVGNFTPKFISQWYLEIRSLGGNWD